jgi:hypothetical protein
VKHPAYEIISGPSGKGLHELYAPEINSTTAAANSSHLHLGWSRHYHGRFTSTSRSQRYGGASLF